MALSVAAAGYIQQTAPNIKVTLAQTDTILLNFVLARNVEGTIFVSKNKAAYARPEVRVSEAGILRLCNINDFCFIRVFGIDGKLYYQSRLKARSTSLTLHANVVKSCQACVVSLTQKESVYCTRDVMRINLCVLETPFELFRRAFYGDNSNRDFLILFVCKVKNRVKFNGRSIHSV
jgi:hypothetical protein